MKTLILSSVIALGMVAAVHAADEPAPAPVALVSDPFFDEVRIGAFVHDPSSPESGSADLNVELLFAKPWGTKDDWWFPRPHIGATINFGGRTSQAYAGASWQYNVTDWAFVEATFGGSVNNGETGNDDPNMNALGCNLLFRESATLGFDVTENWRIMATVEHSSNAGLCDYNRGLTNAGVRLGYKF